MRIFSIVMYLLAAACFLVAFFAPRRAATVRYDLVAAGLFLAVLVPLAHLIDR